MQNNQRIGGKEKVILEPTLHLSGMQKDIVAGLWRIMILSTLAPVVANLKSTTLCEMQKPLAANLS